MSTFDRALAESRLGTYAEIAERIARFRTMSEAEAMSSVMQGGPTPGDERRLLADLAGELAASLQEALDVIENVTRAVAPADPPVEPGVPAGVEVRMPDGPSMDRAWIVEHETPSATFVVKPCPRQQADNAIRSVHAEQVEVRDNLDAAIACAVHGHPGVGFAAYIRMDYLIDAGMDEYVIAL